MPATKTFWWMEAPFLRLLPPLVAGIAMGWYWPPALVLLAIASVAPLLFLLLYSFLPTTLKYRLRIVAGSCLLLLLTALGGWLVRLQNVRNNANWFGHHYQPGHFLVATLDESPIAKPNSIKAIARITHLAGSGCLRPVKGSVIIYFQKNAAMPDIAYGSRIVLRKNLQPVQNSGNPGAFDYQRYCLFQNITHQLFLQQKEFVVLNQNGGNVLQQWLIRCRLRVVNKLKRYIRGPQEAGLAEALLIGYKDDLDKRLEQAYTHTGVVHIIAVSGLHVGLIYGLLLFGARPLRRWGRLLRFLFIMAGLWSFALLAGAQPSVVRSAVMFSSMALGELISRRTSPLNTLAFSAFGLLCYNPFWLWDLGFQLSYTAVAGILLFYKPLYHLLYFPNKAVDAMWQLVALTLTAQTLTLPVVLYHFHQFPLLFLITNLLAVPLSSAVLYLELGLCTFSFFDPLASALGWLTQGCIRFLNAYIMRLSTLPFALWDGFSLSMLQVTLLYAAIGGGGFWLLSKNKKALLYTLAFLCLFAALRTHSLLQAARQKALIVYHVPKYRAVDFISGRNVYFAGDEALMYEGFEQAFHLRPARIALRTQSVRLLPAHAVRFCNKTVFFYDSLSAFPQAGSDVLVVSGKAKIPRKLAATQRPQVVMDATVPFYRVKQWQRFCDSLRWPLHDVRTAGAFVMQWQ